jgi:Transcriptional regulator, AbiEi antitoxin
VTPEPAECGHRVISARTLARITTPAALRRLRVAWCADDETHSELVAITAIVLACASASEVAIPAIARDAGLMTTTEYAAAAGITPQAVRLACSEGRIRAVKRGVWLIPVSELVRRQASC